MSASPLSTTISVPVAGGHLYVRGIPDEANSDCGVCGAFPWDQVHGTTFESRPIAVEDCLYRMEASDDHGRNWASNGLRWATQELAEDWTRDLSLRWFGCTNLRIVRESDGEVVKVIL